MPDPVFDAALAAMRAGLNVLPPLQDGSKAPDAREWASRQHRRATEAEVQGMYANGRTGLGLVCGSISGGLELFEFEGRAVEAGLLEEFDAAANAAGLGELVERIRVGYAETTPKGGIHLLYYCTETKSTKLACTPARLPLIETKGEGGYVIVAPSNGAVHETGNPWAMVSGGFDTIATITPGERAELHRLARTFDQAAAPVPRKVHNEVRRAEDGIWELAPWEDFAARVSWEDILEPHGWRRLYCTTGGQQHWCRPGKKMGTSATVADQGEGPTLYVFSSSTPFEMDAAVGRFHAWAVLNHGGDDKAACAALVAQGYGRRRELVERRQRDNGDPGPNDPDGSAGAEEPAAKPPVLDIITAAELVARVESAPPVGWLVRPVWPADAYGIIAAEMKAGKTWAGLDLAMSVASATPWLGLYPVDTPGSVLVFLGEGGQRKMKRRLDAICKARGLELAALPLRLCFKVPHLTDAEHMKELGDEMVAHRPVLVIIDPLYLAARGAKSSDLIEMGAHLERVQTWCQAAGAALVIIHHWNKTGEGKGAKRMTGAGAAEWGRVLVSVSVRSRNVGDGGTSTVILDWEFMGDELAEVEQRFRRRVWADDPDDLSSPMHYELEAIESEPDDASEQGKGLPPAARRVLAVLVSSDRWLTVQEIGDAVANDGHPLRARTIGEALRTLKAATPPLADSFGADGTAHSWAGGGLLAESRKDTA